MTPGPAGPAASADGNQIPPPHRAAPVPARIVLTGFMGAGKSTVGGLLATRLGWPFLDIDAQIAAEQRLTVAEIFSRHGESHFRALEAQAIATALAAPAQPKVIALGGGAVETESVRTLLFPDGAAAEPASVPSMVTIFLSAPLPVLLARCSAGDDTPVRPLLATGAETPAARLERRLPHYRRAQLILDTHGISPAQVVERILDWLAARFPESRLG